MATHSFFPLTIFVLLAHTFSILKLKVFISISHEISFIFFSFATLFLLWTLCFVCYYAQAYCIQEKMNRAGYQRGL